MRSRKGRTTGAILSEALIRNIRLRGNKQGVATRELALEFGMAVESIRRILRYETWGWVTDEGPGAEAAEWVEPLPAVIAASQARVFKLAGLGPDGKPLEGASPHEGLISTPPFPAGDSSRAAGYGAKPMPTMAESMAAAARESDEVAARVKATFEAKDAAGNAELAGLLGTGGIQSPMSNEKLKDSHD